MASPPFNINQAIPGDNDVVSQHPTNARTFRDVVESWLLIEHNVQGRHDKVSLDHTADLAGTASVTRVWASTDASGAGIPKMRLGTGAVQYVGVPPGICSPYAGSSAPEGWLMCDGTAVSRSTYARLFAAISTNFGVGDGATTFNVPDLNERVVIGRDMVGGTTRVTTAGSGIDGNTLAAAGGAQTETLDITKIPAHTHGGTTGSKHLTITSVVSNGTIAGTGADQHSGSGVTGVSGAAAIVVSSTTPDHDHTITSEGGGLAHNNMPPGLVMNYIIKT